VPTITILTGYLQMVVHRASRNGAPE
jgi:hypothetical protein